MKLLDQYHYTIPPELIAQHPASPRDSARLLVYDTNSNHLEYATFKELGDFLPQRSLLVFNDTRVVPARLSVTSDLGEPLELFLLIDEGIQAGNRVRGLVSRYVRVGEVLSVGGVSFMVHDNHEKWMDLETDLGQAEIIELLMKYGTTPIPPYIDGTAHDEAMLRREYQSVFAQHEASVAAPTASLHFTVDLLHDLRGRGHTMTNLTLHVGLGTFAPVAPEQLAEGRLHQERYFVSAETSRKIKEANHQGRPIVAVGTTVVRTLESAKAALLKGVAASEVTELFIQPPYQFTFPDVLITNFHVPRSSLMCMVDAFLKHKGAKRSLLELYECASREKFRFYSFGDGMLIR